MKKILVLLAFVFSQTYALTQSQIGEMIMVGFRGQECPDNLIRQLEKGLIGGVVLFDYDFLNREFDRNIRSPEQVKSLCHILKIKAKHPLWIAIDQEGGVVNRLKTQYGFPATLSQQELGEKNDLIATLKQSRMTAELLSHLGINVNYAPVVDLLVDPDSPCVGRKKRSFSEKPIVVAQHAREVIQGHREYGILCVLKHFPGHGSAGGDTHEGFVDVTTTWKPEELEPYEMLIRTRSVDMIMTAHIYNKALDPQYPASLSKIIIQDLLRGKLRYDGVIISDDMQMKAIAEFYTLEETIVKALEAGVDVLLFANQIDYDPEIASKAVDIIERLIQEGKVKTDRLEQSLARIHRLKKLHILELQTLK